MSSMAERKDYRKIERLLTICDAPLKNQKECINWRPHPRGRYCYYYREDTRHCDYIDKTGGQSP
jgi:hypothetical protein